MSNLIAKKNWIGLEGKVSRNDTLEDVSEERAKELIDSGRAVYADENKSVEVNEIKGGSTPDKAENKDIEVKKVEPAETKEKPARKKRRSKAEIEAEKNQEK